jgi:hypothetical protein
LSFASGDPTKRGLAIIIKKSGAAHAGLKEGTGDEKCLSQANTGTRQNRTEIAGPSLPDGSGAIAKLPQGFPLSANVSVF